MTVNWFEIKNEYISGNISYRKLAENYGIAFQTLRYRALKENWFEERKKYRNKLGTKSAQKIIEKTSDERASQAQRILDACDVALNYISQAINQVNIILYSDTEAIDTGLVDVDKLHKIVQALKDIKDIIRALEPGDDMQRLDKVLNSISSEF